MRLPCEAGGVEPEKKSTLVILMCFFLGGGGGAGEGWLLFYLFVSFSKPKEHRRTSQTLVIWKD